VAEFPGRRGWGYDGVLLYAPHHAYGGPSGFKRLIDAAHGEGIAVVLDVVYNHLGPSGNHLARFGPYFTDRHSTPWGEAVNFDGPDSIEVRRFFCDNALQWLRDYHVDGLRLDAVHAIHDESAVHILEQLASEVGQLQRASGRSLWLIAESDLNDPRLVRSRDAHGLGLDAAWSDDFHHAVHAVVTGQRDGYYADFGAIDLVARALDSTFIHDGRYSPHRRRNHGRPADVPQDRFVCFLQNHDQIGNRALGERLPALAPRDTLFGAPRCFHSAFVPLLFKVRVGVVHRFAFTATTTRRSPMRSAQRRAEFASFASFSPGVAQIPDRNRPTFATLAPRLERTGRITRRYWRGIALLVPASPRALVCELTGRHHAVHGLVVVRRGGWTIAIESLVRRRRRLSRRRPRVRGVDRQGILSLGPHAVRSRRRRL
jgi:maltooligosyltrehalose trehalohydrolase